MQTTPSGGFNSNWKMQGFIDVCYIDIIMAGTNRVLFSH